MDSNSSTVVSWLWAVMVAVNCWPRDHAVNDHADRGRDQKGDVQIDEGMAPPERRTADHGRLNALLGLAEALGCRRQTLLRYFGEESAPCGNCDLCDSPPEVFDGTEAVRKALSAALRTGENFGAGHLIDMPAHSMNPTLRAVDGVEVLAAGLKDLGLTQ